MKRDIIIRHDLEQTFHLVDTLMFYLKLNGKLSFNRPYPKRTSLFVIS